MSALSKLFRGHPMLKGMALYSVIWPTSSIIQQLISKEQIDLKRTFRYFLFGTFFAAPALHGWMRLTSHMWPKTTLKTGIAKSLTEQVSYGPAATIFFFVVMSLMERKSFKEARMEVVEKYPPVFKVSLCFWPFFQMINFSFVNEKYRFPAVAVASFGWTIFLTYMRTVDEGKKQIDQNGQKEDEEIVDQSSEESVTEGKIVDDKMMGK